MHKRSVLRALALVFTAALLFAAVGAGAVYAASSCADMFVIEGDPPVPGEVLDPLTGDRMNMLFIGFDKGGYNTDTIMVLSYDRQSNKIYMLSIPRDTRIQINGRIFKINKCVALGGTELLINTVRDITGIPIQYYAKVDTSGFRDIIDILGGVWFDVPQDMKYEDPYQDLYIDLKEGYQLLDGDRAEQLVRFRRYRGIPDLQRAAVQRDFFSALVDQKLNSELITKLPELYGQCIKYVKTNFSLGDLLGNIGMLRALDSSEDRESMLEGFALEGEGRYIGGVAFWLHDVEYAFEIGQKYFGGSGTSDMKQTYIDLYNDAMRKIADDEKRASSAAARAAVDSAGGDADGYEGGETAEAGGAEGSDAASDGSAAVPEPEPAPAPEPVQPEPDGED